MIIDNQLLLGVVFITAGIALALLAYAVLLNRRGSIDDETEEEAEAEVDLEGGLMAEEPEPTRIVPEPQPVVPPFEEPTRLYQEPSPVEDEPAQEILDTRVETEMPEPAEADAAPVEVPEATVPAQPGEPQADVVPVVSLERDPHTGKLRIDVGEDSFDSMNELKASDAWEHIGGLFEELHAWMTVVPPQSPPSARADQSGSSEATVKTPGEQSMVEQINEILADKLAASATAPQGVHMAEAPDGSIRVFIGVQGYAMDQVPNDEVRRLIREAVSEWESRS
jgi:hypothetical protein